MLQCGKPGSGCYRLMLSSGRNNTVKQARAISGVQQVHAVIGGFHLFQAADAYVANTVAALREINPDHVIPMHCSGDRFSKQFQAMLPDTLIEFYVGTRYIFGG